MRRIVLLLFALVCIATPSSAQAAKGWRGIIPLHSSRADVERLLGPSHDQCNCFYETEHEKIIIEYARQSPCKDGAEGLNVPPNTVLLISISPKEKVKLADLHVDLKKFQISESEHEEGRYFYVNNEDGLTLIVFGDERVGMMIYEPTKNDINTFRCRKCF